MLKPVDVGMSSLSVGAAIAALACGVIAFAVTYTALEYFIDRQSGPARPEAVNCIDRDHCRLVRFFDAGPKGETAYCAIWVEDGTGVACDIEKR